MEIGQFAEHMFLRNKDNKPINLSLEGIENNKDLFLFMIDLFCKGLVLCYGTNNSVDFDSLNVENFAYLKKCMHAAGIVITLDIIELPIPIPTSINGAEIDDDVDDKPLESYVFRIYKNSNMYQIRFSLTHNI